MGAEGLPSLSLVTHFDHQIARDDIDFFPKAVDDRRGRKCPSMNPLQAGALADADFLVEISREDFLLDPFGVPGHSLPVTR